MLYVYVTCLLWLTDTYATYTMGCNCMQNRGTPARARNISDQQHLDMLALARSSIQDVADDVWPAAVLQRMTTLWSCHFNAVLLEWVAAFAGVRTANNTKSALVQALVEAKVHPISTERALALIEEWKAGASGDASAADASQALPTIAEDHDASLDDHGPDGYDVHGETGNSDVERQLTMLQDRCAALQAELAAKTEESSAASILGLLVNAARENHGATLPSLSSFGGRARVDELKPFLEIWGEPSADLSADVPLTTKQKWLVKQGRLIMNRRFVDPADVGPKQLSRLDFNLQASSSSQISSTLRLVSDNGSVRSQDKNFDPVEIKAGLQVIVAATIRAGFSSRAAGLLAFSAYIWDYPGASEIGKAKFIKYFLFAHPKENDLVPLVSADPKLVRRFLDHQSTIDRAPSFESRQRFGRGQKRPRFSPQGTRRQPEGSASAGPRRTNSKPPTRICFSRARPSVGECSYAGACKFDHRCASCGADHPASKCPSWNEAKGQAAASVNNSRTRM